MPYFAALTIMQVLLLCFFCYICPMNILSHSLAIFSLNLHLIHFLFIISFDTRIPFSPFSLHCPMFSYFVDKEIFFLVVPFKLSRLGFFFIDVMLSILRILNHVSYSFFCVHFLKKTITSVSLVLNLGPSFLLPASNLCANLCKSAAVENAIYTYITSFLCSFLIFY